MYPNDPRTTEKTIPEPSFASFHPTAIGPSTRNLDDDETKRPEQTAMDLVDEACMESFPCSDPPCYTRSHA